MHIYIGKEIANLTGYKLLHLELSLNLENVHKKSSKKLYLYIYILFDRKKSVV